LPYRSWTLRSERMPPACETKTEPQAGSYQQPRSYWMCDAIDACRKPPFLIEKYRLRVASRCPDWLVSLPADVVPPTPRSAPRRRSNEPMLSATAGLSQILRISLYRSVPSALCRTCQRKRDRRKADHSCGIPSRPLLRADDLKRQAFVPSLCPEGHAMRARVQSLHLWMTLGGVELTPKRVEDC
jgi:hypothetical protein